MAVPKRKHSKARTKNRRVHYKAKAPGLSLCTNCGELKPPHRVCPSCGYYKGRTFIKEEIVEEPES